MCRFNRSAGHAATGQVRQCRVLLRRCRDSGLPVMHLRLLDSRNLPVSRNPDLHYEKCRASLATPETACEQLDH